MTPDEARDLLDGATPGPWVRRRDADGNPTPVVVSAGPTDRHHIMTAEPAASPERQQADAALIAAAPDMAHMIAEMHEEWGVLYEYRRDGQSAHVCRWVDIDGSPMNHHAARRIVDRKKRDGYDNVRIIRRYVTPTEEIK